MDPVLAELGPTQPRLVPLYFRNGIQLQLLFFLVRSNFKHVIFLQCFVGLFSNLLKLGLSKNFPFAKSFLCCMLDLFLTNSDLFQHQLFHPQIHQFSSCFFSVPDMIYGNSSKFFRVNYLLPQEQCSSIVELSLSSMPWLKILNSTYTFLFFYFPIDIYTFQSRIFNQGMGWRLL